MEKLKKARTTRRQAFTRVLNKFNESIQAETPNFAEIKASMQLLDVRYSELETDDTKIFELLIESDADEKDVQCEMEMVDDYKLKYIQASLKGVELTSDAQARDSVSVAESHGGTKQVKTYKLPKIELRKFDGEIKEWLQFWSQFKKIHEDDNIANEDKFQYLIQAMVPGSRARELVQSFPPTGENYEKVILSLKNRFGRDDLQVEVYVRELLKLVLQNAMQPNMKTPLSSLYDRIESQLRALETLGVTTDKCAAMLFPLVESSLPEELLRAWRRSGSVNMGSVNSLASETKDRLTQLIEFLQSEVENEQRISMAVGGFELKSEVEKNKKTKTRSEVNRDVPSATGLLTTKSNQSPTCVFCGGEHESDTCRKAREMNIVEKQNVLREKNGCFNCLKIGHGSRKCRVRVKCAWCDRKHVVVMCPELSNKETTAIKTEPKTEVTHQNLAGFSKNTEVLLQTLRVKLRSDKSECTVRAIIDTGSQKSYILKKAVERMGYTPVSEHHITHALFGGVKSDPRRHQCYQVRLGSLTGEYACNFKALDQDVICGNLPCAQNAAWEKELEELNIKITDNGDESAPIQVLIGADIAGKLLTGQRHVLTCGLVAVETLLGWTLMGKVIDTEVHENTAMMVTSMFVKEASVCNLWELDVLGIRDPAERKSQKEHEQEVHDAFLKTVQVVGGNRYEVDLPWLESHPALHDNRELAVKRLETVTRKLKAEGLFNDYDEVFKEWKLEGIIEEVPKEELTNWGHYLPHRHVIKENSTTRIRPVFDASARTKNSPSLNQCLEKGPNLIELVASILLRFRKGNIGVIADIKKAFLQIGVSPKDRDFLRFLWYDEEGNIIVLRHTRVVFGVSSSPFILGAVIDLHLRKLIENDCIEPSARYSRENLSKLLESFYVDNCVTSVDHVTQLTEFISEAKAVMELGGFDLRGWESSLEDDSGEQHQAAVLGIIWNKKEDTLALTVPSLDKYHSEQTTKRSILSLAHRIFDPLGLACPVALCPKLLLQETWSEKIQWDDKVSEEIRRRFLDWVDELQRLGDVKIPRCMIGSIDNDDEVSIHTFCDASQLAYAAVIFVRIENRSGVTVRFVQAKSRVAPVKRITIPRLELLAATVAARLTVSVLETLKCTNVTTHFWSDSTTVLAWIHRKRQWGTFVWNRVQEIRRLTNPSHWRHVPGEMNPADLPSRGCSVTHLLQSKWWEGPEWLGGRPEDWPKQEFSYDEGEVDRELRKTVTKLDEIEVESLTGFSELATLQTSSSDKAVPWYAGRFSSYNRIIRLIGWIKRFVDNCRCKAELRPVGELRVEEINKAEVVLMKIVQTESFTDETDSRIRHLQAYKDEEGVTRLKTKIVLRDDSLNFRCPILLPAKHHLVQLLVRERHENLAHAGVQILMSNLRENFWILGGRKSIRSVISKCVVCRRHDSKAVATVPVALPVDRIRDAAIFEVVGVDFAGPVFLKGSQKAWICLFTCAVFRAVHLELVTSLSTTSFIEAVRRFVSRRGRPTIIYSDNGTNFVGLDNLFKRVDWDMVSKFGTAQRIKWKFNPPTAAWWGGWWERLIGVLKRLLRKVLKKACLTYEEMSTVLCDCEAIINSRPLTFMSDSGQDLVPLTPAMFLQEIKEVGMPDCDQIEECKLQKRFMYRQKVKNDLRRRFRTEYLGELVHHNDKNKVYREVRVGDVVLIENDNAKRLDWPLARVKEVFTGKDGKIRVVRLSTATGEVTRPVQRIYPLELNAVPSATALRETICKGSPTELEYLLDDKQQKCDTTKETVTRKGRIIKKPVRFND